MNIQMIGNGNITSDNFNTSFLINNHTLVETPPGVLNELKRMNKNIDNISIIIISHLHGGHYLELPTIIIHELIRKRTKPLIIIGPKQLRKRVTKLLKMTYEDVKSPLSQLDITFVEAEAVQKANLIDDLYFSAINVKHGNLKNCYAYIIKNKKATLGFTGDIKSCPGLFYLLKEVKHCFIDVSDNNDESHLKLAEFKSLAANHNLNFIPVHFPDTIKADLIKIKNVKIIEPEEQFFI